MDFYQQSCATVGPAGVTSETDDGNTLAISDGTLVLSLKLLHLTKSNIKVY